MADIANVQRPVIEPKKFEYRCWYCQMKTPNYTIIGGKEKGYCPFHIPRALATFRYAAYMVMLKGAKRYVRK